MSMFLRERQPYIKPWLSDLFLFSGEGVVVIGEWSSNVGAWCGVVWCGEKMEMARSGGEHRVVRSGL